MFDLLEVKRSLASIRSELDGVKREIYARKALNWFGKDGFNEDEPRNDAGRWVSEGGVSVETSEGFATGIPTIDQTSEALSDTLVAVMENLEYLPSLSPAQYGVAVHAAFGLAVSQLDLPGVGDIERSFSLDTLDPTYGMAGTIRTDVTLRNVQGDIIAIYDVKTGNARISASRADELREVTRASPTTPVFELNILRGISRKSCGSINAKLYLRRVTFP